MDHGPCLAMDHGPRLSRDHVWFNMLVLFSQTLYFSYFFLKTAKILVCMPYLMIKVLRIH